jgi:hypothetical protein
MPLFLENSFSLNNYISISNRIKKISFYYLHFLPVHSFKNLDEQYKLLPISKSNLIQREIKHKLIYFQNENEDKNQDRSGDYERNKLTKSESIDSINIDNSYLFKKNGFAKSIYHVFLSCSILHENKISFTLHDCPFISCDNSNSIRLPLLYDFSQSFYFPIIQSATFKMYFPKSLLQNKYIPFDQYLIIYLIHHPIDYCDDKYIDGITELFSKGREKIEINTLKENNDHFYNRHPHQIINYLLQFKYTWSYYALCYFFIEHYSDLLDHFSLYEMFRSYIHSPIKDRTSSIVSNIHESLFMT